MGPLISLCVLLFLLQFAAGALAAPATPAQAGLAPSASDASLSKETPAKLRPAYPRKAGVVMYSAEWCAYCKQARKYLRSHKIAFTEYDIDKNADARKELIRQGGKSVPFFVIGKQGFSGFSASTFEARLHEARSN